MEQICSSYREYESPRYGCQGYCMGTRECEACRCSGDEAECDFYPEKRDKAQEKQTNLYNLQHMDIDAFAEWLDENCMYDDVPWVKWMVNNYCDKCGTVTEETEFGEMEYAPCEFGADKCPYAMADISTVDLIKMWLEDECDDEVNGKYSKAISSNIQTPGQLS